MSISPARDLALTVMGKLRVRDSWAHETLDSHLAKTPLGESDRAFVTRLVYGTTQTQGTLDEVLDEMLKKPSRVHPAVRDVLRLAAYELLYDRGDAHAVVHDAVAAARKIAPHSAGMTNAVLRRLAERAASYPWGDPETDQSALARETAHPRWLVDRLVGTLGHTQAAQVLRANNTAAPLFVAHNPFLGSLDDLVHSLEESGAQPESTPLSGCLMCRNASAAVRSEAVSKGLCLIADAGAQFVADLAAPDPGEVALDIGAGRGTKSALMARRAAGAAKVIAVDVHEYKTEIARKRMGELSIPNIEFVTVDATDPEALGSAVGGQAAKVLIDAPCSGLGALRRMPDKRWRIAPQDTERLAKLGTRLLKAAARLVRVDGVVVYSTCTILPEENDEVVEAFVSSVAGTGFVLEDVRTRLPEEWSGFGKESGVFQSLPESGGPDGHFAAVLRRTR